MPLPSRWIFFATAAVLLIASGGRGADRFLTIGGGPDPHTNQVSLEKNVLYLRRVLNRLNLNHAPHDVLFADGEDPARDVQFADPEAVPELRRLLAAIVGPGGDVDLYYRTHELPFDHQPADVSHLYDWFQQHADKFDANDRLILYFTGHGGESHDKRNRHDTQMYLWGDERLKMTQFAHQLDRLPPEVPVVLVMVQCYSGGFANVIFQDGDPARGLAAQPRAGFFATVHDRPAAGCTPDIYEPDYQEYSSFFWAALAGENRTGKEIDQPDYDGDGRTSFAEAHAFALLKADNIDISVKTSDALLRAYSSDEAGRRHIGDAVRLMPLDTSYARIRAVASKTDRAVLDGLSRQLNLGGDNRITEAHRLLDELDARREVVQREYDQAEHRYERTAGRIRRSITERWPELSSPWHERAATIVSTEGPAVLAAIQNHPAYPRFQKQIDQLAALANQDASLEHRWAKARRFLHVAESVVLAFNLPHVAEDPVVERYEQLIALENQTLGR